MIQFIDDQRNVKPERRIRCPRCGYDQRGVIATWHDSCPLLGTCSECGLTFIWAEVMAPEKFEPPWCVEFAPKLRRVPMAATRTFARSFWPWTFWSRLKMSQPIRRRRLVMYLFLLLTPLLLVYVLTQSALAVRMRYLMQAQCAAIPAQIQVQARFQQVDLDIMRTARAFDSMTDEQRAAAAATPPPEFASAQQYQQYIEQVAKTPPETLDAAIRDKQQALAIMRAQINTPPTIQMSYPMAVLEAIFVPLAQWSSGTIVLGDGTALPYPAPVHLYDLIGSVRTGPASWDEELALRLALTLLTICGLLVLMPASFILLPVSRRLAKVRWAHVARIFIYSAFAFITVLMIMLSAGIWYLIFDSQIALAIFRGLPPVAWICITIWWAVAIKRYLKMPHAGAVAGLLSFMLALLMIPLLMHILPQWIVGLVFD